MKKLSETESKYRQFSCEMVDAINRLRETKEQVFPDYLRRLAEAQLEYYRQCIAASEKLLMTMDQSAPIITHTCVSCFVANLPFLIHSWAHSSGSGYPS